ncbi:hypothetical protein [Streptomyces zagrosensis]|uniref:Uncharacterized protein n=1 Tax=Streptomyces zagrosensis TaxID=1042984 RepID=A0A7W9Q6T6_9ACTN|nr:hypothetical protein [Streptomyces zagrosensis]MBB5934684.1 hypothetical protein [Streptomyces zagrosensis]
MPSIDAGRRRLRLSDAHISALGLLVAEEELPPTLSQPLTELRSAGIVHDEGTIDGELYPLISTLMSPRVIVRLEISGPQGTVSSGVVVGDQFAFSHEGWPDEEESEYAPVEASMLVWELARMVDLHTEACEFPDADEQISSMMGPLDALLERFETKAAHEREDYADVAAACGAPVRLAEILAQLNAMWRMTVVWPGDQTHGDASPHIAALAVWDCGIEGYWVRTAPAEPIAEGAINQHSELCVRRTSAKGLWRAITDLLPDTDQLLVADGSAAQQR